MRRSYVGRIAVDYRELRPFFLCGGVCARVPTGRAFGHVEPRRRVTCAMRSPRRQFPFLRSSPADPAFYYFHGFATRAVVLRLLLTLKTRDPRELQHAADTVRYTLAPLHGPSLFSPLSALLRR